MHGGSLHAKPAKHLAVAPVWLAADWKSQLKKGGGGGSDSDDSDDEDDDEDEYLAEAAGQVSEKISRAAQSVSE
jgi:hypothetical protein